MTDSYEISNDADDPTQIRFVRMQSGEDIVTKLVHIKNDKDDYYQFIDPLKIVYMLSQKNGNISLSLVEWIFPRICESQEFQIYPSDVVTVANCTEDLIDYYYEALYKYAQVKDNVDFNMNTSLTKEKKVPVKVEKITEIDEGPSDEEVEYIKKVLDDLTKNKRMLH